MCHPRLLWSCPNPFYRPKLGSPVDVVCDTGAGPHLWPVAVNESVNLPGPHFFHLSIEAHHDKFAGCREGSRWCVESGPCLTHSGCAIKERCCCWLAPHLASYLVRCSQRVSSGSRSRSCFTNRKPSHMMVLESQPLLLPARPHLCLSGYSQEEDPFQRQEVVTRWVSRLRTVGHRAEARM